MGRPPVAMSIILDPAPRGFGDPGRGEAAGLYHRSPRPQSRIGPVFLKSGAGPAGGIIPFLVAIVGRGPPGIAAQKSGSYIVSTGRARR